MPYYYPQIHTHTIQMKHTYIYPSFIQCVLKLHENPFCLLCCFDDFLGQSLLCSGDSSTLYQDYCSFLLVQRNDKLTYTQWYDELRFFNYCTPSHHHRAKKTPWTEILKFTGKVGMLRSDHHRHCSKEMREFFCLKFLMSYVFVERFKLINDMKHSLRNGFNYLVNRVFTLLTALLPRKTVLELFWVRKKEQISLRMQYLLECTQLKISLQ